jgi:uncharacterized protein YjbJ (UPF0337 family)
LTVLQQPLREAACTVTTPLHSKEASAMNKDIISGKWSQLKGKAQAKWGDLTNDDFDVAEGNAEYLAGRLQERYGWAKDRAEKEVRDFQDSVSKDYPDYK